MRASDVGRLYFHFAVDKEISLRLQVKSAWDMPTLGFALAGFSLF